MVISLGSLGDLDEFLTALGGTEMGMAILIMLDQIERLGTSLTSNLDSRPSNTLVRSLVCLRFDGNGYLT